ncbi:MAG: NAD-dependent epimerase/dehydratase family protein, partial [Deltaproteobacteria bacterium]|nr:NAD-dependent epimerase/dehydratase family protein [Deltaproteobacteria bacterium]
MRVLVTGGAGFIGSHIVDALLKEGHEVGVIDDLSTGRRENLNPLVHFVELDIRNEEGVAEVMSNVHLDAVCPQAAQTSVVVSTREPLRDASINVIGTIVLLEACVRFGVKRFVFASTGGAIYGEVPEPEIAKPGRKEKPISPYACSKLAGEVYVQRYAREHGLQATILRYANVYGPRQDPHGEAGV